MLSIVPARPKFRRRRCRLAVALLAAVAACGRGAPDEHRLRLVRVDPSDGRLFLNHEIVLTFDRRIDPESVTEDTVRLVDSAGHTVSIDRLKARSFSVTIVPRIPYDPKLETGSFLPGRGYRLELPTFPRSNSLRGARGELLEPTPVISWVAVDPETLPTETPSALLHSARYGRLQLYAPPQLTPDGRAIRLMFTRPVYPPSAVPRAFTLMPRGKTAPSAAIAIQVSVERGQADAPGGPSSVLRLEPARPLANGFYELYFRPGVLVDYRLVPVFFPNQRQPLPGLGVPVPFRVEPGKMPATIVERFSRARRALELDPSGAQLELPGGAEGALLWDAGALRTPALGYAGFASLGELRPQNHVRLQSARLTEIRPGVSVRLPATTWDFDRFVVPAGLRVRVELPDRGPLRIRVAGRFEIAGDLVFVLPSSQPRLPKAGPRGAPVVGDPRSKWAHVGSRVEIQVGGLARISGRVLRQTGNEVEVQTVPGFLWGRGPFLGRFDRCGLELWQWPLGSRRGSSEIPRLPGRWLAVSPWYPLARPTQFEGRLELGGRSLGDDIQVLFQGERDLTPREFTSWGTLDLLPTFGRLRALRFVIRVTEPSEGRVLLDAFRLR